MISYLAEEPRRNMNDKNRNMSDNSLSSQETPKVIIKFHVNSL
jgi:hypothetical protein